MRIRHQPPRSPSTESFHEKFKTWNTSLSNIQLRASLVNKAGLRSVQEITPVVRGRREDRDARPTRHNYTKSTPAPAVNELAKDSAIDLSDLRDRYTSGDRIFGEHEQNSRRLVREKSRDRSRSRVCVSARGSTHPEFDNDAIFLQRIEATRIATPSSSTPQPLPKPASKAHSIKAHSIKHAQSMSRVILKTEKALPPLPDGEVQPYIKRSLVESIKSSRHLRNMKSLTSLKTNANPRESMDFACVGSPVEAVNVFEVAFEERELQNERDELLRSINLTRNRMCDNKIELPKRSAHLDREAREAANDLDRFDSVPAGSTVTTDDETATAQLIGPAGYSGLATGERWASLQYQGLASERDADSPRGRAQREPSQTNAKKPVLKLNTKILASTGSQYNMFTAITGNSWKTIGMARTSSDRRWVVVLSASSSPEISNNDDAKSMRSILTPAGSVKAPRSKSKARTAVPRSSQLPSAVSYGTLTPSYSDDDVDSIPATPSIPVTPILTPRSPLTPILGADRLAVAKVIGIGGEKQQKPKLRCHARNAQRLAITYDTLAPDFRSDEGGSPVTPVLVV